MRRIAVTLTLLAVAACGDNIAPPLEAELAGLTVRVEHDPARLVVTAPDGTILLDGLPGGAGGDPVVAPQIAAATRQVDATYEFQVGSFRIEEELNPEAWRGVRRFAGAELTGNGQIRFELRGAGGRMGEVVISAVADFHLRIQLSFDEPANRAAISFGCNPDEHFLGFGGQTAAVDHRGANVPLWVQEDGITKAPVDSYDWGVWFLMGRLHSTHTPMPIYLSSRGYGLLVDTPYRSVFDMCAQDAGVVRVETWERTLDAHLFYGPTPAETITRLTTQVGRPQLPPPFTFAPWLDAIFGQDNVRRVAQKLRSEGVPTSVIWSEDWRGGNDEGTGYVLEEDWEVDRDLYPEIETLADQLHDNGFKFLIYHNSFLDQRVPAFAEATAGGHTIRDASGDPYLFTGVKFEPSTLLDLSSPDAVAWAKQKYRDSLELGTDGYMADFAEWLPTDAVLASGEEALAFHNRYPVEWARLNKELLDEMHAEDGIDRLFFVRAAYLGSQPLVSVVWAGDQQTDFTEDDGLASVIPMGIGLGVTGFPYFGHDIAGYMSQGTEPTSKELFFRWTTFGALSPVMRTHHGRSARDNWNWESDAETTAHFRRWARLHIRLFPYLYALAGQAAQYGTPMFRPLALDYPEFEPGWTARDQYALGDRLLVAPIVTAGATSRSVWLPPGVYYRLGSGSRHDAGDSGAEIEVDVAIDDIAVFVPAGALLVLLPADVDTLAPAAAGSGVVGLADVGDDREIWLWPGGTSQLTEQGGLEYEWDGAALTDPAAGASYNGAAVAPQSDAGGVYYDVTGAGSLTVGGATLIIRGGAADRSIRVRFPAS